MADRITDFLKLHTNMKISRNIALLVLAISFASFSGCALKRAYYKAATGGRDYEEDRRRSNPHLYDRDYDRNHGRSRPVNE